jgi:ligand-binding sensor domain-containing protein/serine phosphatase RsbU (regulator of sigma subunit)
MPYYRFYILIFILQLIRPLEGQSYLPPELLPVVNGLSTQEVTSLIFDNTGYLWTATQSELSRYDGYNSVQFPLLKSGQRMPNDQQIKSIRKDKQGNLWVLAGDGLILIQHKTIEITYYSLNQSDQSISKQFTLRDIYPGKDGEVWVLSDSVLISVNPGHANLYYPVPRPLQQPDFVTTCLLPDINNNLWIGTSAGILFFDHQQHSFTEFMQQSAQGLLTDQRVNCLFLDAKNFLWIGTKNGLNRFDQVDYDFDGYFPAGKNTAQQANIVTDIHQAPDGNLIIATEAGLFSYDEVKGIFSKITQAPDPGIKTFAIDEYGVIWGGTTEGIVKIRMSRLPLRNYSTYSQGLTLPADRIIAMSGGPENELFIGYSDNTYDVANPVNLTRKNFKTLDNSRVMGFYPFNQLEYIALSEHELEIINPRQEARTRFSTRFPFIKKDLLLGNSLNCLLNDRPVLWLGTSEGLQKVRLDSANHYVIDVLHYDNQSIDIGPVFDIEKDLNGKLWLATTHGLLYYDPQHGNFDMFTPYDKTILNTEHKQVYTIVPESPEVFLIGTSMGVYRFDVSTREFTAALDEPALLHSAFKAMTIDHLGNIWICSGNGLYVLIHNSESILFFDQREGLVNSSYSSVCSGVNGKIYLGGDMGLSEINPDKILSPAGNFRVMITGFRFIADEPQNDRVYYNPTDTLLIPWKLMPIRIDVASANLSRPEINRYRYSLEKYGDEPVWHSLGSQNSITLDHLDPGRYFFRVTGTDAVTLGNNTVTSLLIIVEAPKWRTRTALIIYFIVGFVFILFAFRLITRRFFNLSKENQEREMFALQIMLQKEELTLKNKSITDSINYAKRIQTAMLPPYRLFKSVFPSSFVLYMPKDIVSGDFYWINKLGDKIFVAAVDCTGHGVPGAFMSIIGFELFRKITNIEGLSRPSDILNRLNEDFHVIFKDVDNVVLRDGMDVAFCSIDKKNMILEFAGAFNPLYLIRDNKITEVKGDRFAIGLDETNFKDQTFKNHLIPIQQGDIIYIFSDGFADQFGGPDGKKYKYRRFRHLLLNLHRLPMDKQHEILENNVMEWRGQQEQVDDILVIGIKIDF